MISARCSVLGAQIVVFTLFAATAFAQDPSTPLTPLPLGDTLLTLPTSHIPDQGTWEVKFSHRFNQSIDEGEAIHSLFGLDSGANVTMGLSYTLRPKLQLALVRSNVVDTLEASAKYIAFQQAAAIPVTVALRGGVDLRTEEEVGDRTSFFAQAVLSRQFGERLSLFAVPTVATDAGRAVSGDESVALFQAAFNVPVGAAVVLGRGLSIVAELIPPNTDLPDHIDSDLGWALGVKRAIGRHHFEILLTNSNATTVDQYVTGTYQGGKLRAGDLQLGFNIERRFGNRP